MKQFDWWLVAAAFGLTLIGILAIQAATQPVSGAGPVERQLAWAAIAALAMLLAAWPSFKITHRLAYVAFGLCIPLLLAVYWTEPVNGAQRWLRLGPVGLQPSELVKITFVLALARYLGQRQDRMGIALLIVAGLLTAIPAALILRQPDLGTAMLFPAVLLAMLFGAGLRTRYWVALMVATLVASPFLWKSMSRVQRSRITSFLQQSDTGARPRDVGYQLYQSKLMISLGSTAGSSEALEVHLPFDHTDFIFSVIAGRWGLAGVTATLALFAVVFWRGFFIAAQTEEPFGRLAALGLVVMLATQTIINLAMTVGMAPITGLTLPFVSYGGSSLLTCFLAVGVLLSIRRHYSNPWRFGLSV